MRLGGRTDIKLIYSLFATLGTRLKSVACEGYATWPSQRPQRSDGAEYRDVHRRGPTKPWFLTTTQRR